MSIRRRNTKASKSRARKSSNKMKRLPRKTRGRARKRA